MRRLLALLLLLALPAPAAAISHGRGADIAMVPFVAKVNGCTATLVAADRVLTAAHCIAGFDPEGKSVVVGADPVRGTPPADRLHAIRGYSVHPGYKLAFPFKHDSEQNATAVDDVALVLLARPVTDIAPVPLADAGTDTAAGRDAIALGYGATRARKPSDKGPLRAPLQRGELRLISRAACLRAYPKAVGTKELCAADPDGGAVTQPCPGDSGGPLLVRDGERIVQAGVVSWGPETQGADCGRRDLPGVWMRVSSYRSFILDADPTIAPWARAEVLVTGSRTLRCTAPAFGGSAATVRVAWVTTTFSGRLRQEIAGRAKRIRGATRSTFTPGAAQRGRKVACAVSASNRSGTETVYSRNVAISR